jgi:hypothetical protein
MKSEALEGGKKKPRLATGLSVDGPRLLDGVRSRYLPLLHSIIVLP